MNRKLAILYVDDEPDIREVAAIAFGLDDGVSVRTAGSGREALDALGEDGYRPDVILLDVMMPQMDGPGTLVEIRKLPGHGKTPVIFITARAQAHELAGFLKLGAIGVITKPFDPMMLPVEVRAMVVRAGL
ncbi:MAG TPA: response regulator [Caulobacteraceae bacterium]|jgi:CheY-like chemotaxis protein|nr:response regulator [Caulobacteraceae bacterium]